jgi:hypothetical protein
MPVSWVTKSCTSGMHVAPPTRTTLLTRRGGGANLSADVRPGTCSERPATLQASGLRKRPHLMILQPNILIPYVRIHAFIWEPTHVRQ